MVERISLMPVKSIEAAQLLLTTAMHPEVYESAGLSNIDRERWLNQCARGWEAEKRYTFAVTQAEMMGGVWLQVAGKGTEAQIGYWIDRAKWGHGFATESVERLIDYAEKVLGIGCFLALIKPENIGSCKVAVKCGFKAVDRTRHWNISQQKEEDLDLFIRGIRK